MTINEIKERSEMERLIKKYMTMEKTREATTKKLQIICMLLNYQISDIDVISIYYQIIDLNNK